MEDSRQDGSRSRQKRRTRAAVLQAAVDLMASGVTPTVAEAAEAADVSRRTAYRYFPSQQQLLTEAVLESLRPEIQSALEPAGLSGDVEARLDALVRAVWTRTLSHEPLLRTMIRLTVDRHAQDAETDRHPRRGYRRIDWIEEALAPLHGQLDDRRYERLVSALALCIGIESLLVLRDIRGLAENEAEEVSRWAARSLLRASLEERD